MSGRTNPNERKQYNKRYYETHKDEHKKRAAKSYRTNKEKILARLKRYRLLKRYGITTSDYEKMLSVQGGRCAICSMEPNGRHLSVDHSHKTGEVRGLLCDKCNFFIGVIEMNPKIVQWAWAYLHRKRGA